VNPIPIPSAIHYELPLQLLEQEAHFALVHHATQRQMVQELIATLRKALALQKRLEESCARDGLSVDHRWSLSHQELDPSQVH
jgi:hypothetical protein